MSFTRLKLKQVDISGPSQQPRRGQHLLQTDAGVGVETKESPRDHVLGQRPKAVESFEAPSDWLVRHSSTHTICHDNIVYIVYSIIQLIV